MLVVRSLKIKEIVVESYNYDIVFESCLMNLVLEGRMYCYSVRDTKVGDRSS